MALHNRGFGLAGHINIYSSKTKIGNWCEDTLSAERIQKQQTYAPPSASTASLPPHNNVNSSTLAASRSRNQFLDTEYRRNFGQYKTSDPAERQQMARSIIELKTKNKEGLSYSTLFEHGSSEAHPEDVSDRYVTNTQRSMSNLPLAASYQCSPTARQLGKWREMKREMEDITIRRPETRDATAYWRPHH